jgi:small-conductance mechanosensitive channel
MSFITWNDLLQFLETPLIRIGETQLSAGSLIKIAVILLVLIVVTGRMKKWLVNRVLIRTRLDLSAREAIGTIFHYVVLLLGVLILVQSAGIDLTTLNVLAGALGVGVGFGLQSVASNFVSGLIILFERPVKLGDRIEVGDIEGEVVQIRARATTVLTNDNVAIIIPNSKFITENVVNWTYNERSVRFRVTVGVAYGVDVRLVEKLLLEVAAVNPDVQKEPAPVVRFVEFGDSSLQFELRVWSSSLVHRRGKLLSSLNFGVYEKFREHNIQIPFPQRDLHVVGGVEVRLKPDGISTQAG